MSTLKSIVAACIFTISLARWTSAVTWYLPETPIQNIYTYLAAGDVISIKNGSVIDEIFDFVDKKDITVQSRTESGAKAVLTSAGQNRVIYLQGCTNIQFKNLEIRAEVDGIKVMSSCINTSFINCDILNSSQHRTGTGVYSGSDIRLSSVHINNFITGVTAYAYGATVIIDQRPGYRRGSIQATDGVICGTPGTYNISNQDLITTRFAIRGLNAVLSVEGNSFVGCTSDNYSLVFLERGILDCFWENLLPDHCIAAWTLNEDAVQSNPNKVNNAPYGFKNQCSSPIGFCTPPPVFIPSSNHNNKYSLLIAYDQSAKAVMHKSYIFSEIDRLNNIYKENEMNIEAVLVKTLELPFTLPFNDDFPPCSDVVNPVKEQFNADIAVFLVSDVNTTEGGVAYTNTTGSKMDYAMVNVLYQPERYTLAHEIGHLFGANHEHGVDLGNGRVSIMTVIEPDELTRDPVFSPATQDLHKANIYVRMSNKVIPAISIIYSVFDNKEFSFIRAVREVRLTDGFRALNGAKVKIGTSSENDYYQY